MLKKIKICFFFLSFFWLISISAKTITLEDAERIALEENKELNALIELSNASFERAQEIVSRYMPQATFQGAYYKSEEKIALLPGFPPQDNFWTTGFQFSQLILSKKLYHEIKSGKFDYEAMKYEVENFKNDLLYQVRVAYWEAVLNKEDIRIQEENIKLLQESLAQEEMKEAAGKSAIYQVTQSKVAVANSRSSYFTAQRDYRRSLNNLKQTLGIDPNSEIEVADEAIKLGHLENYFIQDPCYWQNEAYENNPNLKRQAYEVYSHNELKKSHQGEYLPEISTLASYQQQFIPATKFTNQNYTWVGGFYLYWNLFDGFGRESRIRQEIYRERSSAYRYQQIADNLSLEVLNQLSEAEESFAIMQSSKESLALSELALKQALDRLKAGKITSLEYRDSALAHLRARQTYERSAFNVLRTYYQLKRISGKDVE